MIDRLCIESPVAEPFIHIPLEPGYLNDFPELGGHNMSISRQKLLAEIHNDVARNVPKMANPVVKAPVQQQPQQQQQQQQQQQKQEGKPLLIMCDLIPEERETSAENEFYLNDPDTSPRSYSDTIKLRPQLIQAPPVPIRPQPIADLQVFPFLKK